MLTALFINKKRTPFDLRTDILANRLQLYEIANFISSCQFHCHSNVTTNNPKAPQIGFDTARLFLKQANVDNFALYFFVAYLSI